MTSRYFSAAWLYIYLTGTEFIYFEMFMWIMCNTHIHIIVKLKEKGRGVSERESKQVRKISNDEDNRKEEEISCELVYRVSHKKVLSFLEDMMNLWSLHVSKRMEPTSFSLEKESLEKKKKKEKKKEVIKMEQKKFPTILPIRFPIPYCSFP